MSHEQIHRARYWDREIADEPSADAEATAQQSESWDPAFAPEDDPDEDLEVLTDGADLS